jgi:hypothetical protein
MRYIYFLNPQQKRWYWRIMDLEDHIQIDPENDWKAVAEKTGHSAGPYRFRRFCLNALNKHQRTYHPSARIEKIGHPIIRGKVHAKLPRMRIRA